MKANRESATVEQRRESAAIRRQLARQGGKPFEVTEYGLDFRNSPDY